MEKKWTKSFRGLNPKDVEKLIASTEKQFQEELNKLNTESSNLMKERESLKNEIGYLEEQMSGYNQLRKAVEETLYNAHIKASMEVYEKSKRFDDMIAYKTKIIRTQQNKNADIKSLITKLLDNVNNIVKE